MKRTPIILGAADGLTAINALVMGFLGQPHELQHAAVSGALAELVGMTAASWLSEGKTTFWEALSCGCAGLLGCIAPPIFYFWTSGVVAIVGALLVALVSAGIIAWLRPEHGWQAVAKTYGVLVVAAGLSFLVNSAI